MINAFNVIDAVANWTETIMMFYASEQKKKKKEKREKNEILIIDRKLMCVICSRVLICNFFLL